MFRGEARGLPGLQWWGTTLQEEKTPLCRLLKRLLGGDGGSWQASGAKQRQVSRVGCREQGAYFMRILRAMARSSSSRS